jgi:hypothetical protein
MFSNLAYVKGKLRAMRLKDCRALAAKLRYVSFGTLRRIKYEEKANPSAVTVDKLALHFRTQEQRSK